MGEIRRKSGVDGRWHDNRHGYRPGDRVTGAVRANYFFGQPVDGAEFRVKASAQNVGVVDAGSSQNNADADGAYRFEIRLPDFFARRPLDRGAAQVWIEATVKDNTGHSETYGLSFNRVFKHPHLAIGSYRFAISRMLPEVTRAAVLNRRDQIIAERPDFAERQFLFAISATEYRKEFGQDYERPSIGTRILSFVFRHVSHSGALTALDAVNPTPQTENYFVKSVDFNLHRYRKFLATAANEDLWLRNWNFDTGRDVTPGEYGLADSAYAQLLLLLSKDGFATVDADLRQNMLAFYDASSKPRTVSDAATWDKITKALEVLRKH